MCTCFLRRIAAVVSLFVAIYERQNEVLNFQALSLHIKAFFESRLFPASISQFRQGP